MKKWSTKLRANNKETKKKSCDIFRVSLIIIFNMLKIVICYIHCSLSTIDCLLGFPKSILDVWTSADLFSIKNHFDWACYHENTFHRMYKGTRLVSKHFTTELRQNRTSLFLNFDLLQYNGTKLLWWTPPRIQSRLKHSSSKKNF